MTNETCMVGQKDLLEMIERGEIFQPGTWEPKNVRGAAYDLRVAEDFLVVPDKREAIGYKRYKKGEKRETRIVLEPGDVAFVSSQEKIHMPWTLAGNIGIKFGLARNGVLILTGLIVDPGFGMEKRNNSWVPREDERIHFLFANLGLEPVKLSPGETKIASLQFFRVPEPPEKMKVPVESGKDMYEEFFLSEQQHGLVFVKQAQHAIDQVKSLNKRIDTIEKGTTQIVMFGVYLLCASIVAGAGAFILSILSSEKCLAGVDELFERLPNNWPQAISLLALIAFVVFIIKCLINIIFVRKHFI